MSGRRHSKAAITGRWGLELLISARLPLTAGGALGAGALGALGEYAALAGLGGASIWAAASLYRPNRSAIEGGTRRVRICHWNINAHNKRQDAILDFLTGEDHDLISLVELSPKMQDVLHGLRAHYGYEVSRPAAIGGRALFSRWPLAAESQGLDKPVTAARVEAPHGPFRILQIQTRSPRTGMKLERRNRLLRTLADHAFGDLALLVAGDFNAVDWSPEFSRFARRLKLENLSSVPWPRPTWPSGFPLFPIDHVLCTRGARLVRAKTRRVAGSDHLALLVELDLPAPGNGGRR